MAVTLANGNKETDCRAYPSLIKKPTTTAAPTTQEMTTVHTLGSGDVAAIVLGVILILIIILLLLFAVYLYRGRKYRYAFIVKHLIPSHKLGVAPTHRRETGKQLVRGFGLPHLALI